MIEECDLTCLRIDFIIFSRRRIIITRGGTERIELDINRELQCLKNSKHSIHGSLKGII